MNKRKRYFLNKKYSYIGETIEYKLKLKEIIGDAIIFILCIHSY